MWHLVSDRCIYGSVRHERCYSPRAQQTRALSSREREDNDGEAREEDSATCSLPAVTLTLQSIVKTSSSSSSVEAEQVSEPALSVAMVHGTDHPKEAADV